MERDILIDGYNVIKNDPMFRSLELRNLAQARHLLIHQLKNRYRRATHRVTVVFDGNDMREHVSHDDHIRIIFSRQGETADRVIARLAEEARLVGQEIAMYSDDAEVRYSVAQQGGNVHTTRQLTSCLNAAPSDVARRFAHRQAMRRLYGLDPMYKGDDEQEVQYEYHKKKKRKSSRRY